jgi:hypothetical protein
MTLYSTISQMVDSFQVPKIQRVKKWRNVEEISVNISEILTK